MYLLPSVTYKTIHFFKRQKLHIYLEDIEIVHKIIVLPQSRCISLQYAIRFLIVLLDTNASSYTAYLVAVSICHPFSHSSKWDISIFQCAQNRRHELYMTYVLGVGRDGFLKAMFSKYIYKETLARSFGEKKCTSVSWVCCHFWQGWIVVDKWGKLIQE